MYAFARFFDAALSLFISAFMLKWMSPLVPFCLRVASIWSANSVSPQPFAPLVCRLAECPGHRCRPFVFSPAHHSSSFG